MKEKKQVKEKAPETKPQVERVEIPKITFEDYIRENKVHPGMVASFSYEASLTEEKLAPRTSEEWRMALEAQANRKY